MQNIYAVFGDNSLRLHEEIQGRIAGHGTLSFSIITFDIQVSALMNQWTAKAQQAAEQVRERFLFTLLTDREMQDSISKRTGRTVQTTTHFINALSPRSLVLSVSLLWFNSSGDRVDPVLEKRQSRDARRPLCGNQGTARRHSHPSGARPKSRRPTHLTTSGV